MNGTMIIAIFAVISQGIYVALKFSRAQEVLAAHSYKSDLLASNRFDHVEGLRSGRRMLIVGMTMFIFGDVYLAFLLTIGTITSLLVFGMSVAAGSYFVVAATMRINAAYRLYLRRWNSYKREHWRKHFGDLPMPI